MKNKFLSGVLSFLILLQITFLGYNQVNAAGSCPGGYTYMVVTTPSSGDYVWHDNSSNYVAPIFVGGYGGGSVNQLAHYVGLSGEKCYKKIGDTGDTYKRLYNRNGASWVYQMWVNTSMPIYEIISPNFTPTVTSVTVPSYINSGNVSSTPFTINGINDTDSGQTLSYEYSWDNTNWIVAGTGSTPASNRNFSFNVNSTLRPQGNNIMYVRVGDGSTYSTTVSSVNITKDTIVPTLSLSTTGSLFNTPNPRFDFTSTEGGVISYSGSCDSNVTVASIGNNGIFLNALTDNTYSNCSLRVTDAAGNISSALSLGTFEIDTVAPVTPTGFIINSSAQFTNNSTVNVNITHPNESDVFGWCLKEDTNYNACTWNPTKPSTYQIQN